MKVPRKILPVLMPGLFFFACLLPASNAYTAQGKTPLCPEDAQIRECFKTHFHEIAITDLDLFEKLLRQAHEKMQTCRAGDVGYFLDLSLSRPIGTEHAEFFSEEIEKTVVSKPECFLNGLKTLAPASRARIWEELKNPLIEDKEAINKSLTPYKNKPGYKELF